MATQAVDCRYMIYGHELAPTTGTPHLQGYVYFHSLKSERQVIKLLPGAHVASAKGNAAQNYTYCSKDEDFFEKGTPPSQGRRNDLTTFVEHAKEHRPSDTNLIEEFTHVYARYPRFVQKVINHYHPPTAINELDNYWIYGPTRTGKSTKAREIAPAAYYKLPNKWFCDYVRETSVIIDDLGTDHAYLGFYLKIWADHYPFRAETKGGSLMIRPPQIVVTSNYHPKDIWADPNMHEPILRRFKLLHFTTLKKA